MSKYNKIITSLTLILLIASTVAIISIYKNINLTHTEDFPYTSFKIDLEQEFLAPDFPNNITSEPITLIGKLYLPHDYTAPLPAVILQHGSGGNGLLKSWHKEIVAALTARHIAVLVADSHSARGITTTANDQAALTSANRLLDTAQALIYLSQDERIDKSRIGIAGDSYGALIALRLAETSVINALTRGQEQFAAHAMLYPPCNATPETLELTDAPLLMLLGGKDDYTYADDCLNYAERIKQENDDLQIHIFETAYHGWLYNIPPVKFAEAQTFNLCRMIFTDDGNIALADYDISTEGQEIQEFYAAVLASGCVETGAHVGRDREARRQSTAWLVDFFSARLLKNN